MSNKSDRAKLELILKYIADIERIIERHGSIDKVISDYEGQYAVMMCLTQIAETIDKITSTEYISKIPSREIMGFRNRIVHDYESTDWIIISKILCDNIPELKTIIISLVGEI